MINRKCLQTLYYSLIYPYLTYCNIIWGATYPTHLKKLHLTQKRFCRIATYSDWSAHSAPLFKQLNILTISDLNVYLTCNFIFKVVSEPVPSSLPCRALFQFNSDVHHFNTRQANHLHLPKFHSSQCKFSIRFRGAQLWNTFITLSSNSTSVNQFKHKLRIHLMN